MKRLGSSESLGALISICQTTDEHSPPGTNHVYDHMEFQSMYEGLDEEGVIEECGQRTQKKRRLNVNQVKALEKNFEVENKLEPERKVKLAQELGLQPRQVAVWFQNRRARWKTKNLERDYGILKANYDALKRNYETIQHDNQALLKEIGDLKSKLDEENSESNLCVREERTMSESDNKVIEQSKQAAPINPSVGGGCDSTELNLENNTGNGLFGNSVVFPDLKDGSSDSDSSAILNEENNINPSFKFNCSSSSSQSQSQSSINWFQFSESKSILGEKGYHHHHDQQLPFVKIEEHNFLGGDDESCNFFSEEQAPTLQWYCNDDQWREGYGGNLGN